MPLFSKENVGRIIQEYPWFLNLEIMQHTNVGQESGCVSAVCKQSNMIEKAVTTGQYLFEQY